MPLIRVLYMIEKYDFDYVSGELLGTLIAQDRITHFYRPSEGRWVNIRLDPIRGSGGGYQGPERRGKDKGPKAGARCSDWLEGLWQQVESHDALG